MGKQPDPKALFVAQRIDAMAEEAVMDLVRIMDLHGFPRGRPGGGAGPVGPQGVAAGRGAAMMPDLHHRPRRSRLPARHGTLCTVVCRGRMNSIGVLVADGWFVVTSRFAVRRVRDA